MKKGLTVSAVFFVLFILMIFAVSEIDVQSVGPEGTEIGLATFNMYFHQATGVNMMWYKLSEVFGIVAILFVGFFAGLGAVQLFKTKSLLKVDKEILSLGGLYFIMFALYALFEVVVINYRPIIMPGEEHVEASFPSSHTMLICVVMASTIIIAGRYIKNKNVLTIINIVCALIMGLTVCGRLVCGVHWFTDIIAGLLISAALLSAFKGIIESNS